VTTGQLVNPAAEDEPRHHSWREAARAGLMATAAGAIWSFLIDLAFGHPFETWIFLGAGFAGLLRPAVAPLPVVGAVVFLTLAALMFVLFGRLAIAVAHRADAQPGLILFTNLIVTLVTLALVGWAAAFRASSRLGLEAWLQIIGSTLVAFATLGFRVYRTHRSLGADFKRLSDA
jgi:hypothetical protein